MVRCLHDILENEKNEKKNTKRGREHNATGPQTKDERT